MFKRAVFFITLLSFTALVHAQELQSSVTVSAQQVGTNVDKTIFTTLQNQLIAFINNRKWTNDVFQAQEKIHCTFILTIQSVDQDNNYKASLAIQAARPVYNSSYQSALINYQDVDVEFKYVQYQQLEFNENRVQGTDAMTANLTAVFAYYVYMILGFDYDSFALKGGEDFFNKAQNIVNNAPEAKQITGWKSFDGLRNRYWLAENVTNTRYNVIHDIIYNYYHQGLDNMYQDNQTARTNILNALSSLQSLNQQNPNTMIEQFLVQGKSQEFIGIFLKGNPQQRQQATQALSALDVSNAPAYKQRLQ